MADQPERVSPLDDIATPGIYGTKTEAPGVDLSERLCGSLVQVQAWPDTTGIVERGLLKVTGLKVPAAPLSATKEGIAIIPTGPGRWLIDSDADGLEEKLRRAINSKAGAVTGLTHGRVVISIAGKKASWVLASGIALNFDPAAFLINSAQVSHHHEIGLTIHRTGEQSFDLYVFTSYARGFWHWITRASAEVGYTVS